MLDPSTQLIPLTLANSAAIGIGAGVLGLILGFIGHILLSKSIGTQTLGNAKKEAASILEKATADGETLKKQMELDTRNQVAQLREAFDKEATEARAQIEEDRRRLQSREDNLDKKLDQITRREQTLDQQETKLEKRDEASKTREQEAERVFAERRQLLDDTQRDAKNRLLTIANLSEDEARRQALKAVELECQHEAAQIIQRSLERAEEESQETAQKIILQAIQRYASDHTASSTTNAVQIPSDDMKGRVIGREGRNIRAFEKAAGVDVIVDDTPGVIVVSCFDPVRRAVAAEAMHKLIEDGRIHPTRIEEIITEINAEMGKRIAKFGKEACIDAHVQGLHPKVSEAMGRLHYRMSYGQNILKHSLEVAHLCAVIAGELGLDPALARRCGFLHDIGKALDHEIEGGHPKIGADFLKKYGEKSEAVLNAVEGHHDDIPSTTPYTPIVMAADAISGARPGARRETLEKYVKRLQQLEAIATEQRGVKEAYAIQAGREVRVIVDADHIDDTNCTYIARDIAKRVSDEMTFPGEIKVTVLREKRTIEFAR